MSVDSLKADADSVHVILDAMANFLCRYYEGGVSSVYFWDLDDGFAGVVLLKKSMVVVIRIPPRDATGVCSHASY